MKTYLLYMRLGIFMIGSTFKKREVEKVRKEKGEAAAEEIINNYLMEWADFIVNKSGVKINVKGMENLPKEGALYVANHQSLFDVPVLLSATRVPMGFIAKKELESKMIISDWMKAIHCIFMDRENVRESLKSINQGAEILKNGYSLAIFPEGTRTKTGELLEFKKGSMKLGTKAGVPIVPITIDGTYKIREGNKNKRIKGAEVSVVIHNPINTKELDKESLNNLSEIVKEIIAKGMK
ncbi:1-acyl-sn-glycerol-3-phosphate acyltransferase [Clostridium sp. MSJ-11]|uniref:1-acyl-sn-glycerol-3-phosphate acyltransferase n=1 Tax=Clostridium mobile TaxID=2841512 RepID=A0ABS6EFC5_9CLOT|nr:lysophospholipid acyltransferase family protein [Clostridium mobile]MBU5483852.1 1-acyl-sn-glycerol-3-phosphate acyltransferase [Clostridium mobile]